MIDTDVVIAAQCSSTYCNSIVIASLIANWIALGIFFTKKWVQFFLIEKECT